MISFRRGIFLILMAVASGPGAAGQGRKDTVPVETNDTVYVGADGGASTVAADTSGMATTGSTRTEEDDSVVQRSLPDSVVRHWQRDPHFAYANDPDYWRRRAPEPPPGFLIWLTRVLASDGFRYFIYIVLGSLLLYAVIRIMAENNLGLFYRGAGRRKTAGGASGGEDVAEEDLDQRLEYFLQQRDHRQAVRYLYLKTLRLLSDGGLILWHPETTNREYLRQLNGTDKEASFRFLTLAYEKVWYGEFALGDHIFNLIYRHFMDFNKTIRP
jgi:Domain of unknown function (DUF4129)